ncbi:helix-turn-helix transcriptional regulator [Gordonia malaquae]|uniref:helix-turn-helix domain-containing protein n=1 Tax=Gordonia malaquae TaxID=410332 RepID=UPI00301A36D8
MANSEAYDAGYSDGWKAAYENTLQPVSLAEMVQHQMAARGLSYSSLAERTGDVITAAQWQQLGTGGLTEFPQPATLDAIATTLDVSITEVVLAAGRSAGLDVKRGATSDLAAMVAGGSLTLAECYELVTQG